MYAVDLSLNKGQRFCMYVHIYMYIKMKASWGLEFILCPMFMATIHLYRYFNHQAVHLLCFIYQMKALNTGHKLSFHYQQSSLLLLSEGCYFHVTRMCTKIGFNYQLSFSSPEPTILLACDRNRELWEQPGQACPDCMNRMGRIQLFPLLFQNGCS